MALSFHRNTKPWIVKIATAVAALFGIKSASGWREDPQFPKEHPSGSAVDFMTESKAQGDALAAYLTKLPGTQEVIWWRQIWTPSKGWHTYTRGANATDPGVAHTNHVHYLGPYQDPGAAGLAGLGTIPTGFDPAGAVAGALDLDRIGQKAQDVGLTLAGAVLGFVLVAAGVMIAVRPAIRNTATKAIGGKA